MIDNKKQLDNEKTINVTGGADTTSQTINIGNLAHEMEMKGLDSTTNILLNVYHKGYISYNLYQDVINEFTNKKYVRAAAKVKNATEGNSIAIKYLVDNFGTKIVASI